MMICSEKVMILGIKLVIVLKMNLIVSLFNNMKILEIKLRSCGDEATDFQSRKLPEAVPNSNCWSVILIDSALKK